MSPTLGENVSHRGWRAVLLQARSKRPNGAHWNITSDTTEIDSHIESGGNAGITAGPSPRRSGLAILDPDRIDRWADLVSVLDEPGKAWVWTGSGKPHYYVLWELGLPAKSASRTPSSEKSSEAPRPKTETRTATGCLPSQRPSMRQAV